LTNGLFVKTFGENLRQLVIYFGEMSPMNVQLTEKQIRERASDQSFRKGQDYYDTGAIYNPARQSIPGGVTLTAQCEGTSAPSYRLQVELDGGGVRSTSCTCPYDWGGDCKHIVALLLITP